jgi:hypothetical protein
MKSTLIFDTAAIQKTISILVFLPVIALVYPAISEAATAQPQSKAEFTFEISPKQNEELVAKTAAQQLTFAELLEKQNAKDDILAQKLQAYLENYKSPLAPYAKEIITLPQWQRALAITYQESKFCIYAKNNNCGSIGVKPGHRLWRQYANAYEGFKDVSALMEKPIYKERYNTCAKMINVYVVPGSKAWLDSCNKHSNAFLQMTRDADAEYLALLNSGNSVNVATASAEVTLR